jgi:PleD family two-component response regulator
MSVPKPKKTPKQVTAPAAKPTATAVDQLRILLVEDNPDDALLLRMSLAKASTTAYGLVHVKTLSEAKQRLAEGTYDLILLDLMLPDSSGFDTIVKIQTRAPDTAIVVLSGLSDEALIVNALQSGAQDYLVKGEVNRTLFMRVIRYAIERKRADIEIRKLHLELQTVLAENKLLNSLLPVCPACSKAREDRGYWARVENHIHNHTGQRFPYALCVRCENKFNERYRLK